MPFGSASTDGLATELFVPTDCLSSLLRALVRRHRRAQPHPSQLRSTIPNALDGALPRHKHTTSAQWDSSCPRQGITPTRSALSINEALSSCLHSADLIGDNDSSFRASAALAFERSTNLTPPHAASMT